MHLHKSKVPRILEVPGAVARQALDFGTANGCGKMAGEYFSLGAGTDLGPLLKGLEGDLCQSPHWGYVMEGEMVVSYRDGEEEILATGDLFYMRPGHSVKVNRDAEMILFSPQDAHCQVVDHIRGKLEV